MLEDVIAAVAAWGRSLLPDIGISDKYKMWMAVDDQRRCEPCATLHGTIWEPSETPEFKPPLHLFCRCRILPMNTIRAGTATIDGVSGADYVLKQTGKLPEKYISIDELKNSTGRKGNRHLPMHRDELLSEGNMATKTDIYRRRLGAHGMKPTSIMLVANAVPRGLFGRMTDLCLSPMIIMQVFMRSLEKG